MARLTARPLDRDDAPGIEVWHSLARRGTPFQTPEWVLPNFPDADLVGLYDGGRLVGVAPLFTLRKGDGLRYLRLAGGDYEDLVAEEGRERDVLEATLAYARAKGGWDVADFRALPSEGVVALGAQGWSPPGLARAFVPHQSYRVVDLSIGWPAFLARLPEKVAYELDSPKVKGLHKAGETMRLADEGSLDRDLDVLFDLHTRRWNERGLPGSFPTDKERGMMREVCRGMLRRGVLRLGVMEVGGEPAAALIAFAMSGRMYSLAGSFDRRFSKFGPGKRLRGFLVRTGMAEGLAEYDLMKGAEEYKEQWATHEVQTLRLALARRTPRALLALAVLRHQPTVKAWLKARRKGG